MRILISRRAEEDLAAIYAWLAIERGEPGAELFKVRFEDALDLLSRHAQAGPHPAWATRHQDLRYWVISRTPWVIYYECRRDEIAVERVLHGKRDVRRIIEGGLEEPPPEE